MRRNGPNIDPSSPEPTVPCNFNSCTCRYSLTQHTSSLVTLALPYRLQIAPSTESSVVKCSDIDYWSNGSESPRLGLVSCGCHHHTKPAILTLAALASQYCPLLPIAG